MQKLVCFCLCVLVVTWVKLKSHFTAWTEGGKGGVLKICNYGLEYGCVFVILGFKKKKVLPYSSVFPLRSPHFLRLCTFLLCLPFFLFSLASCQKLERTWNSCNHVRSCTAQTSDRVQQQVREALRALHHIIQAGDAVRFLLTGSGLPLGGHGVRLWEGMNTDSVWKSIPISLRRSVWECSSSV